MVRLAAQMAPRGEAPPPGSGSRTLRPVEKAGVPFVWWRLAHHWCTHGGVAVSAHEDPP